MNSFNNINESLDNACGLWLKQPMPNRQYILMTDANFKNACYALIIEGNVDEKILSVSKTYAPVAFGSKMFSPSQIKMSIYAKEFLAIYFAFMEQSHILWESTKPVVVLTDNKSVTRCFQANIIPQPCGTRAILSSNSTSPLPTSREKCTQPRTFCPASTYSHKTRSISLHEKTYVPYLFR